MLWCVHGHWCIACFLHGSIIHKYSNRDTTCTCETTHAYQGGAAFGSAGRLERRGARGARVQSMDQLYCAAPPLTGDGHATPSARPDGRKAFRSRSGGCDISVLESEVALGTYVGRVATLLPC